MRQEDERGESFLFVDMKEDSSHKKFDLSFKRVFLKGSYRLLKQNEVLIF